MKRFVLGMTALLCAVSVQSKKPLVSPEIDPSDLDTLKSVELQGCKWSLPVHRRRHLWPIRTYRRKT